MFRHFCFMVGLLLILTNSQAQNGLVLQNNLPTTRQNEPVVINRTDLEKKFGIGKSNELPILTADNRPIPYQLDDLDGDGRWDELACCVDIRPNAIIILNVNWLPSNKVPVFEKETQVFLARQNSDGSFSEVREAEAPVGLAGFPAQYQSEGVGWENDKIAFRVYFDCRNEKDLFGKLKPQLILQKAGTPEFGTYHVLAPWGMDILHCGSSLGAGGLAMLEGDSLIRLGSTRGYQYKKITDGPVRAIFELRYQGWEVAGATLAATERITLWKGKYWFQSEVTVTGFTGEKELATGITTTKLEGEPAVFDVDTGFRALITHGKQSLNNDFLGMAVLAPIKDVGKTGKAPDTDFYQLGYRTIPEKSFSQVVSQTCYMSQKITSGKPSVHYFFALWGLENPRWNDPDSVKNYISGEAEKLSRPIQPAGRAQVKDPVFQKRSIKKAMLTAALWQLDHPKHEPDDWTNGAFYAGVMATYETTRSKKLYQALLDMGETNQWKPGSRLHHADDYAICQTYINLYRKEKNQKMIRPVIDSINKMMITPYPVSGIRKICWWWCDALFMAPPTLVKLGMTLGDKKYLEFNDRLFHETVELLWNPEESLFARDLNYVWGYGGKEVREANGKKIFWSRGNGWVMGGLARILNELPEDYPERPFYLDIFKKMAKRIASLQQPDGLWRASLLDPESYPGGEASGSGFYCYALAWGINHGILEKNVYLPVVQRAWTGLNSLITPEGFVGWVQPIGADPQKDFSPVSWEVYGTGAFLLAGSEVINIKL